MSKPNNDVKWGFEHEDGIFYYNKNTMREIDRAYKLFLINKSHCVKIVSHKIKYGEYDGQITYHAIFFNNTDIMCNDNTFKLIKTLGKPFESTYMSNITLKKCLYTE